MGDSAKRKSVLDIDLKELQWQRPRYCFVLIVIIVVVVVAAALAASAVEMVVIEVSVRTKKTAQPANVRACITPM